VNPPAGPTKTLVQIVLLRRIDRLGSHGSHEFPKLGMG
jgi:hypothetical protein